MTSEPGSRTRALWIGTYPRSGADPGSGEGVFRAGVDVGTGVLSDVVRAVALPSPSFLAAHPSGRRLYAVGETGPGSLTALAVGDDGFLTAQRTVPSGGSDPCHVVATADRVWVSNYGDGVATTWPATPDGALGAPEPFGHHGSGPVLDRQEGPHAHFAHPAPDDGDTALVADLGADELRAHRAGRGGGSGSSGLAATFPPGSGPRHIVRLSDGALLVAGELDCRLHLLVPEPGPRDLPRYRHADTFPITSATWGPDGGPGFPSHLTLSPDGRYVHVGVRGPDVLAVLRLERTGLSGWTVRHTADVALGAGAWPRHHAVVRPAPGSGAGSSADLVVVAAQHTSELVTVRVDRASGQGEVVARLPFPVPPACVLEA
ncbi:lactonase family protein [Myceligenerans cantabricum]